jgi:integrase
LTFPDCRSQWSALKSVRGMLKCGHIADTGTNMAEKLTDRLVREAAPPATGNRIIYDTDVRGFGARILASGSRGFVLNYRVAGRERRHTIGQFPAWSVRLAREEAARLKREIDRGFDPVGEREEARSAPSIAELADRYLVEHAEAKKKPRSVEEDRRNLKLHVRPTIGKLKVAAVSRDDISRLHGSMRASPIGANRVLALLSKMFGLAETWGLRPQNTNPCRGIDKYRERARDRLVSADELARLGDALAAHKGYWAGPAVIRLMALTGMRKTEALTLRWADIDAERGWIRLADSKTGAKTVPLGTPALALLSELPRIDGNPYVFPAYRIRRRGTDAEGRERAPGHYVQVQTAWQAVAHAAGVADLRLHDLRHAFASAGAMGGDSLFILGKLLGHADAATTQRYAHLAGDPLRAVADRISGQLAAALAGNGAEVARFRKGPAR